jgi:hypothetical protein
MKEIFCSNPNIFNMISYNLFLGTAIILKKLLDYVAIQRFLKDKAMHYNLPNFIFDKVVMVFCQVF